MTTQEYDVDTINRLYAANEAMLEALEALADDVQGVTSGDRLTRVEACRNARAAIKQAKGE